MRIPEFALLLPAALIPPLATGCSSKGQSQGEHSGEHASEGGEESGTQFALTDTYDETRHGVRLILAYDKDSNSLSPDDS